jgi:DNA-binding MarR family transcriptional regulator
METVHKSYCADFEVIGAGDGCARRRIGMPRSAAEDAKDDLSAHSGPSAHQVRRLLSFYYPIHYRTGVDLETVMGQGRVSRKQAAILWLIHSRAGQDGWIRRKDVETRLSTWFEISNSNISKLLRELARAPLSLVEQVESPTSGREKVIRLTTAGRNFVDGMIDASVRYLSRQMSHVSDEELRWGIGFFALSFGGPATDETRTEPRAKLGKPPRRIAAAAGLNDGGV